MIEGTNSFVCASNNPDYHLAVEATGELTVDQIDDFALQAGLGDFIEGTGRIPLRFEERAIARLLLSDTPPQTVEQARLDAGFDGPVATSIRGWSLKVAEEPFPANHYTSDTGVRLVAGMRKTLSRKIVRVPLDLAVVTWPSGKSYTQLGQRQFDAPDTMYADEDKQLLRVADEFLHLVANS